MAVWSQYCDHTLIVQVVQLSQDEKASMRLKLGSVALGSRQFWNYSGTRAGILTLCYSVISSWAIQSLFERASAKKLEKAKAFKLLAEAEGHLISATVRHDHVQRFLLCRLLYEACITSVCSCKDGSRLELQSFSDITESFAHSCLDNHNVIRSTLASFQSAELHWKALRLRRFSAKRDCFFFTSWQESLALCQVPSLASLAGCMSNAQLYESMQIWAHHSLQLWHCTCLL